MAARRKKKKTVAVILAVLILLLGAGAVVFVNKAFAVREITIEGSDKYSYDELYSYIFADRNDRNTLFFKYTDRKAPAIEIPFIAKVSMDVQWPDKIAVTVYEKSIVGYVVYKGTNMYFDKDGVIVECSNERFADVPEIEGLNYDTIVMYDKLEVPDKDIFNTLNNFSQYLEKYQIPADVISVIDDNKLSVKVDDVTVLLGNYDNSMPDKLYKLKCMMPKFDGLKGTLHLEDYDGTVQDVYFKEEQ